MVWYKVKLSDNMMKPTHANGLVEAEDEEMAKERGKEYVGDDWHDDVVGVYNLNKNFENKEDVQEYINKAGTTNLAITKDNKKLTPNR